VFGDHSLQTATLKKERLTAKIERMRAKMRGMQEEYQRQIRKREYAERFIRESQGIMRVQVDVPKRIREMSENELQVEMHKRLMKRRQYRAATLIAKVFKGYRVKKAY
jgi:hypothetical protein